MNKQKIKKILKKIKVFIVVLLSLLVLYILIKIAILLAISTFNQILHMRAFGITSCGLLIITASIQAFAVFAWLWLWYGSWLDVVLKIIKKIK